MTANQATTGSAALPAARLWDVVIVGAGAAGLMTAIIARRTNPTLSVLLVDGAARTGAKILVSGGGRCNVTNEEVTERDFWGGRRSTVRRVLRAFPADRTRSFFESLGVPLRAESHGKLFPATNSARAVRDALLAAVADAGVQLQLGCRVRDVVRNSDRFSLATSIGALEGRQVVLATGGLSLPKTGSDGAGLDIATRLGHSTAPTTPALVGLLLEPVDDDVHGRLSGVSQEVELSVWVDGRVQVRLRGSLLWTHAGISGPAALDASRHLLQARAAGRRATLTASFLPGRTFSALDAAWQRAAVDSPKTTLLSTMARDLPASMAAAVIARLGIDPHVEMAHLSRGDRRAVVGALTSWPLPVVGSQGYQRAEVTAGGIDLDEIDPSTMRSRRCAGLFLVGEILDVDGRLGGFNFQWAWSTGYVAGRALGTASAAAGD